jgi:hypothetical protein
MIHEWKLDGVTRNLGDALSSLLSPQDYVDDEENMYFVIGSVICDQVIKETVGLGYRPVFMNCGWRGEPLSPARVRQATFIGCRGPNTKRELAKNQVYVSVTGDPGYKVPSIIAKAQNHHRSLAIPHLQDVKRFNYNAKALGVDEVVQPSVTSDEDLVEKVKLISGASFVFAGAMHAAILAHAYGVPFALMNNGHVDIPAKWDDWLRSIGVKSTAFYTNARDGERWWRRHVEQLPVSF